MLTKTTIPSHEHGEWWLPESNDSKISGTIHFDKLRITLELAGFLEKDQYQQSSIEIPIIFGVTSKGSFFTLCKCSLDHRLTSPTTGSTHSEYTAIFAIKGGHFEDLANTKFDTIKGFSRVYSAWAEFPGPQVTREEETVTVSVNNNPEPIIVHLQDSIFKINPNVYATRSKFEFSFREEASIEISPSVPAPLSDVRERLRVCSNFFSLASGVEIKNIPVFVSAKIIDDTGEERTKDFEILYPPFPDEITIPHSIQMLFPFRSLGESFPLILQTWESLSNELKPAIDSYFATRIQDRIYVETHFLNSARALEVLHRRTSSSKLIPDEEAKLVRNLLFQALPNFLSATIKAILKGKLSFLNEITLRQRLAEILAALGDSIGPLIPSVDNFIAKVTNTRNYLTHYDQRGEKKAAKGMDLYWVSRLCQVTFEARIMQMLGLETTFITTVLKENPRYMLLRQQLMETSFFPEGWNDDK